jgi:pyruvate formate lyase activating enzyme
MISPSPLVFQMRQSSLDDGPGIRTTVFFKGCPLSCAWCHNPEGIDPRQEIIFAAEHCLGCGDCKKVCPPSRLSQKTCLFCGECQRVCPSGAIRLSGMTYTVAELAAHLQKDIHFFTASGGGVTLSGGEPTFYMDYAGELARELTNSGIHVALQTCGHFLWNDFQKRLLHHIQLIFYDIKLIDAAAHRLWTGVDNALILDNLHRLASLSYPHVIARTPLIPGITDTEENLHDIKELLYNLGITAHQLLPFNAMTQWRSQTTFQEGHYAN